MTKTPLTPTDLAALLQEQLGFLTRSADDFDDGRTDEAKRLAVHVRVLVHDTRVSRSLLGQMGLKARNFLDTATPQRPGNLLPYTGLVGMGGRGGYTALLDDRPNAPRWVSFDDWWSATVFVDGQQRVLTRKDLVLALANQDGGAHVDPELDEPYADLSRNNSLGWFIGREGEPSRPMGGAELAAMRQIAHEVLRSLKPEYRKKPFRPAPQPPADAPANKHQDRRNGLCACGSGRRYKHCHGAIQR